MRALIILTGIVLSAVLGITGWKSWESVEKTRQSVNRLRQEITGKEKELTALSGHSKETPVFLVSAYKRLLNDLNAVARSCGTAVAVSVKTTKDSGIEAAARPSLLCRGVRMIEVQAAFVVTQRLSGIDAILDGLVAIERKGPYILRHFHYEGGRLTVQIEVIGL